MYEIAFQSNLEILIIVLSQICTISICNNNLVEAPTDPLKRVKHFHLKSDIESNSFLHYRIKHAVFLSAGFHNSSDPVKRHPVANACNFPSRNLQATTDCNKTSANPTFIKCL